MTETEEEPPQLSIQARIAALKLDQVGKNPSNKPPPSIPNKPPANRASSAVVLPTIGDGVGNEPNGNALPPLPRRRDKPPPPSLPPRRDGETSTLQPQRPSELERRPSQESISSAISSISAISNGTTRTGQSRPSMDSGRIKAPIFNPNTLPPLPPTRRGQDKATNGTSSITASIDKAISPKLPGNISVRELPRPVTANLPILPQRPSDNSAPALPNRSTGATVPALPSRTNASASSVSPAKPVLPQRPKASEPQLPARRLPPPTIPSVNERIPSLPHRSVSQSDSASPLPPPIPNATRPDLNTLMATKPRNAMSRPNNSSPMNAVTRPATVSNGTSSQDVCIHCRDFSGPDQHAAKFPRQDVPYLGWLAEQLTAPFPSHTDKARAIFAWLHYNIAYDVVAFFGNNVQPSTPAGTIESGLAVCEGYAGLFAALATTAGMEAIVVGGHGKGFGYQPLKAGEPCPPKNFNHAWSAVKIDNGEWKLCDPCWGAGTVDGSRYNQGFNPTEFTKSNEDFGLRHFPNDPKYWYRADGRSLTWEEYYIGDAGGEPVTVYGSLGEGFSHSSVSPKQLHISCNPSAHMGPTIRFQFQRVCPHYDPVKLGKGKDHVFVLQTGGANKEHIPFDNDGMYWWVDVSIRKLGQPGDEIIFMLVDTVGGHSAQGITKDEYLLAKRRKGMSFKYCAKWLLVA